MPYVKDGIGITPRYVFGSSFRKYEHQKCAFIVRQLRTLGIPHIRNNHGNECGITYGDSYDAYVDSLERYVDRNGPSAMMYPVTAYLFG